MTQEFTQTSDKLYDRHNYKLVYSNGQEVFFETYADVQAAWWNTPSDFVSHVEVIDKKTNTEPRGFK